MKTLFPAAFAVERFTSVSSFSVMLALLWSIREALISCAEKMSLTLLIVVTDSGCASVVAATDAATPTLKHIERATIASATPVTYRVRCGARYSMSRLHCIANEPNVNGPEGMCLMLNASSKRLIPATFRSRLQFVLCQILSVEEATLDSKRAS
ncbi:hypothetical protein CQW23_29102 [Capsicum baccatum]|uniref:Uncharacterized protein n=1 Tax=Capsicum baccatum TaxID=33114 RepID=A0A2G2VIF5_CAPBA|nr:hypothetical protein CQW23_29102 [Capsicum baccatum]